MTFMLKLIVIIGIVSLAMSMISDVMNSPYKLQVADYGVMMAISVFAAVLIVLLVVI